MESYHWVLIFLTAIVTYFITKNHYRKQNLSPENFFKKGKHYRLLQKAELIGQSSKVGNNVYQFEVIDDHPKQKNPQTFFVVSGNGHHIAFSKLPSAGSAPDAVFSLREFDNFGHAILEYEYSS